MGSASRTFFSTEPESITFDFEGSALFLWPWGSEPQLSLYTLTRSANQGVEPSSAKVQLSGSTYSG